MHALPRAKITKFRTTKLHDFQTRELSESLLRGTHLLAEEQETSIDI